MENVFRGKIRFSDFFLIKGIKEICRETQHRALVIIVLEALSQEFRTGCPWELLYADDLAIVATSEQELLRKLDLWKRGMEAKALA